MGQPRKHTDSGLLVAGNGASVLIAIYRKRFVTRKELQDYLGVPRMTLVNLLASFKDRGIIETKKEGLSNIYKIKNLSWVENNFINFLKKEYVLDDLPEREAIKYLHACLLLFSKQEVVVSNLTLNKFYEYLFWLGITQGADISISSVSDPKKRVITIENKAPILITPFSWLFEYFFQKYLARIKSTFQEKEFVKFTQLIVNTQIKKSALEDDVNGKRK
jgi:DNA-binding transcriptional ArsR family regulator